MGGLFDYDSKLFQLLLRISDLVILSLLWLLCSLPVVTIGASTTALYYTEMKLVRQRGDGCASMFFRAFRENFKASLPATAALLFAAYAMAVDYSILAPRFQGSAVFHGLCIVLLLLYAALASLAFPVLAKFRCNLRQLFHNVLLVLLRHPLVAVSVTALNLIPLWLVYAHLDWIESLEGILLLFGPGGIAYLNALMLVPVFRRYIPQEQEEANEAVSV